MDSLYILDCLKGAVVNRTMKQRPQLLSGNEITFRITYVVFKSWICLGIVPPVALWAVYMGKKVKSASKNVQDSLASATEIAEEKISNIRTVRLVHSAHQCAELLVHSTHQCSGL